MLLYANRTTSPGLQFRLHGQLAVPDLHVTLIKFMLMIMMMTNIMVMMMTNIMLMKMMMINLTLRINSAGGRL